MRLARAALGLAVALLLLVGCATTSSPSTGNSSGSSTSILSKQCQRLQSMNQALTQLSGIGENTTVGEVKAAQQKLTTALSALEALPAIGGDTLTKVKEANDQLTAAIDNLPDSATIGQVGPRLQDFKSKMTTAQTATMKLMSTLKCSS